MGGAMRARALATVLLLVLVVGCGGSGGGDQVIILNHSGYMHFMLQARPEIRRVEDLRDKRVAITRLGSGVHLATMVTLSKAGLEAGRDVLLVQAGGVDQVLGALVGGT